MKSFVRVRIVGTNGLDLSLFEFDTSLLFPYPHPNTIGLILDPKECATVESVVDASAAKAAGFQKGDRIELLAGQPLLSFADVQWVPNSFHSDGGQMVASITRGNETIELNLKLDSGWRPREDISWRASTWGLRHASFDMGASTWALRRIGLGGMFLARLNKQVAHRFAFSVFGWIKRAAFDVERCLGADSHRRQHCGV